MPGTQPPTPPDHSALKEQFHRLFGPGRGTERVHVIRAPGRVNLIGEHTDYNDGFVLPMAIEPDVKVVCRSRNDGIIRLVSTAFPDQPVEFSVQKKIHRSPTGAWDNYSRGVAAEMIAAGIPLVGMDALFANSLPVGGGLSSSAAVEVGTARALLTLSGVDMDASRVALLCQKAEHEYAGVPVGIMDQTIVAAGKAGHAMLLDCRDLSRQYVPLDTRELRVVIVNSMVKHELSEGEYGKRRQQCAEAVRFFQREDPEVKALRDVSLPEVEGARAKLPDVIFRRARHIVTENARTTQAATQLGHHNYEDFGTLMGESHASLRDDYEVSAPELDFLVEQAMTVRGVYGARMTGGGFGGCIVALAQPRAVDPLREHLKRVYPERFRKEPAVFATVATAGASVLE
jgi:galactokinase